MTVNDTWVLLLLLLLLLLLSMHMGSVHGSQVLTMHVMLHMRMSMHVIIMHRRVFCCCYLTKQCIAPDGVVTLQLCSILLKHRC